MQYRGQTQTQYTTSILQNIQAAGIKHRMKVCKVGERDWKKKHVEGRHWLSVLGDATFWKFNAGRFYLQDMDDMKVNPFYSMEGSQNCSQGERS